MNQVLDRWADGIMQARLAESEPWVGIQPRAVVELADEVRRLGNAAICRQGGREVNTGIEDLRCAAIVAARDYLLELTKEIGSDFGPPSPNREVLAGYYWQARAAFEALTGVGWGAQ